MFEDQSARSGLGVAEPARSPVSATAWFDFDNDGWLDLLTVNGAVQTIEALAQANDPFPLQQTQAAVPQSAATADSRTSRPRPARSSSCRRSAAARRSATSTTTATPTSSSATTTARAAADQQRRQPAALDRVAAGRRHSAPRDMLGARVEIIRKNGADAVATRARRRQLRVGQRPARARRARRFDGDARVRVHWPDGTNDRRQERRDRPLRRRRGAAAMISRRQFLQSAVGVLAAPAPQASALPTFEAVPARDSGINWLHENAMSPQRFLPESLGPGVAFLDYDNDGWMDIYLVNSGPAIFYQPQKPLKNALYQEQPRRHVHRRDGQGRRGGGTFGMGVAVGDYNNDGYPDLFVTAYGRCDSLPQQQGRHVHRRHREGRPSRRRLDDERRVVRLRQRRAPGSLRLQLRRIRPAPGTALRGDNKTAASITIASRICSSRRRASCSTTTATARSRDVERGTAIDRALGKSARRRRHRRQQRRPDGSVGRQRHGARISCS